MATSAQFQALAFLELKSIAKGLFLTDAVLKKAPIEILLSQPVSPGKFMLLFVGSVASVEVSFQEGVEKGGVQILRKIFIPQLHPQLRPFLEELTFEKNLRKPVNGSVGILESQTLASAVLAADRALKLTPVTLCRFHMGYGIGGKAYFVLSGSLEDIQASVETGKQVLEEENSFEGVEVIANPDPEASSFLS